MATREGSNTDEQPLGVEGDFTPSSAPLGKSFTSLVKPASQRHHPLTEVNSTHLHMEAIPVKHRNVFRN